jgi:hypothetical protein
VLDSKIQSQDETSPEPEMGCCTAAQLDKKRACARAAHVTLDHVENGDSKYLNGITGTCILSRCIDLVTYDHLAFDHIVLDHFHLIT